MTLRRDACGKPEQAPKPGAKNLFRGVVIAVSLIALAGASFAQTSTPPAPQPSPSAPTPQPNDPYNPNPYDFPRNPAPAPQPSPSPPTPQPDNPYNPNPYDFPKQPAPKPPEFKSPLGTDGKPGPGEAEAFSNLVALYDQLQAALAAFQKALQCGSQEDKSKTGAVATAAQNAYEAALDQYVVDYSNVAYPPLNEDTMYDGRNIRLTQQRERDTDKVKAALRKASEYKPAETAACPPLRQDTTGNPEPKPQPTPPRPPNPRPGAGETPPSGAVEGRRFSPPAGSPGRLPMIPPTAPVPILNGPRSGALCPDGSHQIINSGSDKPQPCAPEPRR